MFEARYTRAMCDATNEMYCKPWADRYSGDDDVVKGLKFIVDGDHNVDICGDSVFV